MGVSFANSAQWVTETQRIRAALGDLYAAVSDAEAVERDYLLTGSSDYKLQYERVAAEARTRTSAMYAMFEDDPTQLARLQVLESSIEGRLDALSRQLEEFDRHGQVAAQLDIARDEGISSLKSIHAILQLMDLSESKLLSARNEELSRSRGLTLFALIATLTIATTALVMLFNSITRDIRERARIARALPFDELKIDRGFVHGAARDVTLRAICSASLRMAQQLQLRVVAEGIEDREDWELLRELGCDDAQGYFIARPMPAADLGKWMDDWLVRQGRARETG
jgi:CHASE3 domain sensor protein